MESKETKAVLWTIGAQLLWLAIFLLVVFTIVAVASKGWKKGSESGYCMDGNKDCYQY